MKLNIKSSCISLKTAMKIIEEQSQFIFVLTGLWDNSLLEIVNNHRIKDKRHLREFRGRYLDTESGTGCLVTTHVTDYLH